jgi:hypothetical protein
VVPLKRQGTTYSVMHHIPEEQDVEEAGIKYKSYTFDKPCKQINWKNEV